MIGRRYKKKHTDHHGVACELWHITGTDGVKWTATPVDFGPNVAYTASELRREFTRAGDVEAPEPPSYDTETNGWQRLSAEQRFQAIAAAAEAGHIHEGHVLTVPGWAPGETRDASEPLTRQEVGRLRAAARKLRGPVEPTPEEVFAGTERDATQEAAEKITGSPDALVKDHRFSPPSIMRVPHLVGVR